MRVLRRNFTLRFALCIGFSAAIVLQTADAKATKGETYTCFFAKAGKVIIDTREPGTAITYQGKKYPAVSGSYFYQTNSDKTDVEISLMYKYTSAALTKWTITVGNIESERARRCLKKKNVR
jgi:phage-related protein